MDDIVGFGADAVVCVSLATGGGHVRFAGARSCGLTLPAPAAGTARIAIRAQLADVNGDGMADIVGFGADAVVGFALATGGGHFGSPVLGTCRLQPDAGGWSSQRSAIRGTWRTSTATAWPISSASALGEVVVSLATGGGHFASPGGRTRRLHPVRRRRLEQSGSYPRLLADINGDGKADIVGFGADGVAVSLATGGGTSLPG